MTVAGAGPAAIAVAQVPREITQGDSQFLDVYRELVETNTTLSAGSCTAAAQKIQKRLTAAGFGSDEARVIIAPEFPKQGNLVARMRGTDANLPAMLLLAHIDVVEARAADWQRDPFSLIEEDGVFFARGALDDKAMAAIFVDTMIRLRKDGTAPRRTIKLALTCGEETDAVFNGVQYLLANEPQTLSAGFALNEGGKSFLDDAGKPLLLGVQAGEKIYQDFTLTTTSAGGHSARPGSDNAITRLAEALTRIGTYKFAAQPNEVTRAFFAKSAARHSGPIAAAMQSVGRGEDQPDALSLLSDAEVNWNALLRTTCVATLVEAGHAVNALPQTATANVNCRILPGRSVAEVQTELATVIRDPSVGLTLRDPPGPVTPAPPLSDEIMQPIEQITAEMWPGVPIIASMSTGATDGRFLLAAGIPTYGVNGIFIDPDGNGVHGLNERVAVKTLLEGRVFLDRLVRNYAGIVPQ